ncbi:hypothetical protein IAU60_001172 [Kwoniella sp. DSM 27419]
MLTKATAHFRPFIRLPSSGAGPDHFTANPSLLHHLPHGGAGNTLVAHGQASTQTAGGSGSAGRHGYGGNAGAGGGYTGHARAFLSLPQTASVDPSSTLTNSDDTQLQGGSPSQRTNLLLKHRLSKRTRIIGPHDGPGREVRREIEARAGGSKVQVLELEGEEGEWSHEQLALPSGSSAGSSGSRRRSSIAYPSQAGLSTFAPRPTLHSSPASRDGLSRSQTTLELWQVGMPQSKPQLGLRSLSTQASAAGALVSSDSTLATRVIGQPNRVLMDLAGRDVPSKRIGMVRRNSTAAVERASLDRPPVDLSAKADKKETTVSADAEPRAKAIYSALYDAQASGDEGFVRQLIAHYRSPRSVSPFAQDQTVGDPALAQKYPLPEGYSLRVYNACLSSLMYFRQTGQSIAPVLEIYNEILERDLVPNAMTYNFVIRALALRSTEVENAIESWEGQKRWGQWRADLVGAHTWNAELAAERDQLLASYAAEGNLNSATKLFRAASMTDTAAGFGLSVYGTLLQAMSKQAQPDTQAILQIKALARQQQVPGRLSLYQWVFAALGRAKNLPEIEKAWKSFSDRAETPTGEADWMSALAGLKNHSPEIAAKRAAGLRLEAWESAMVAFIAAGDSNKAFEILNEMIQSSETQSQDVDYTRAPAANHRTCGILLLALANAGNIDLCLEWMDKLHSPEFLGKLSFQRLSLEHMIGVIDACLLSGRAQDALQSMEMVAQNAAQYSSQSAKNTINRRFWRVQCALVGQAARATGTERNSILDQVKQLQSTRSVSLDVDCLGIQLALLTEAGRYDDLAGVIANASRSSTLRSDTFPTVVAALTLCAKSDIPSQPLLALLHAAAQRGVRPDSELSEMVVAKYIADRGTAMTDESCSALIDAFGALPRAKVNEAEYDDALLALLEDLTAAQKNSGGLAESLAQSPSLLTVARHLKYRFGAERSASLLTSIFGEEQSQALITSPRSEASGQSDSASASSPSFDSDNGSQFSLPSSVAEAAADATSVGQPEYKLRIDRALSASVERFTQRNPAITPLQAYELVRQGLTRNAVPYSGVLCSLIDHLARAGDEPKVRELYSLASVVLSTIIRPDAQARSWHQLEDAMLIASCHLGHLEQAGMHRARIVEAGMAPSADAYATMIASSKDTTDDALVARELFDESQMMGVKPHLYLYNTIISKLSKARKAETALELFKHMKSAGIRPSSVTYGAVINACCRVGDAQSAETLFEEMASQPNFRARVPPFNTMMQFYLQTQPNRERVLYYYNALRLAQVPPSAHTYKLLLDTYATLAPIDLEAMENVFAEIQSNRSVPVQGAHWASLITAYGLHARDLAKAKEVFDRIPGGATREAVVWEAMLNVLAQSGSVDELELTRHKMASSGVQPTAYVYNALINGYSRANKVDQAREVFESMGDSVTGVAAPNNHPTLLTSSGHTKPNTVTSGPTDVVYREPSTYEAMIRAEVRAGERQRAEQVLQRMEERGYPVAVFMRGRAALDEGQ